MELFFDGMLGMLVGVTSFSTINSSDINLSILCPDCKYIKITANHQQMGFHGYIKE